MYQSVEFIMWKICPLICLCNEKSSHYLLSTDLPTATEMKKLFSLTRLRQYFKWWENEVLNSHQSRIFYSSIWNMSMGFWEISVLIETGSAYESSILYDA